MKILLSTVSSDSHTWNLVFLQLLLEESGHDVVNLGPCVPDELLIRTARRERPDAIVISSVNGHGHLDGARLIRGVRADPDLASVPAMIGGKLGIRGSENVEHAHGLMEAGFDAVFTEGGDPGLLTEWLSALSPPHPSLPAPRRVEASR
ncbi:cobalamin B12-binding domain-containing protein [Streptomyces sp. NPDC088757]|uniref:cobalamin B12-binding domain-containing protein n=1 Tax=Streptomyces sp. NPDC088757 TaxID=3365889 RepID=UPI0038197811